MTTSPVVRGYVLTQSISFIESDHFEPQMRRHMMESLPSDVVNALPGIKPQQWYSRDLLVALQRAVASSRDTEAGVYDILIAYGAHVCGEATNTFLKLLLKILTPALFAKKIPDFWQRDHRNSARFTVDVQRADQGLIKMHMTDAAGFDHIAIPSMGFVLHALTLMGKKNVRMTQQGWSLATPGPNDVDYEVSWT
jgi:hypothetical protein